METSAILAICGVVGLALVFAFVVCAFEAGKSTTDDLVASLRAEGARLVALCDERKQAIEDMQHASEVRRSGGQADADAEAKRVDAVALARVPGAARTALDRLLPGTGPAGGPKAPSDPAGASAATTHTGGAQVPG